MTNIIFTLYLETQVQILNQNIYRDPLFSKIVKIDILLYDSVFFSFSLSFINKLSSYSHVDSLFFFFDKVSNLSFDENFDSLAKHKGLGLTEVSNGL